MADPRINRLSPEGRGISLFVRNTDAVVANLYGTGAKLEEGVRRVVSKYGKRIKKTTKELAPYKTGAMYDNVRLDFSDGGRRFLVGWYKEDFPEAAHFYPFYQEYGSRRNPAHPSLGPAYQQHAPGFKADLGAELRKEINRQRKVTRGANG